MNPKQIKRFMSKVEKSDNCWIWTAGLDKDGYGQFSLNNKTRIAHRISFELFKEIIPQGLTLDHLCRNRKCVNPDHLEIVTIKENLMRGSSFSAINSKKSHCPRGHSYSGVDKRGHRICSICNVMWHKIYAKEGKLNV